VLIPWRIAGVFEERKVLNGRAVQVWEPTEVPEDIVALVHSEEYLKRLHSSPCKVAEVIELPPLALLPMCMIQPLVLRKMRVHAAGTILAAALAVCKGWAINLGGGMHHASYNSGSGWCPYSDITMAIQQVRNASSGTIQKVCVIDTDAHQGNGYARDKLRAADEHTIIVDLYNAGVRKFCLQQAPAVRTVNQA
jgi:histone deacetylase 11